MKERGVRASFKPLGRPKDDGETSKRWFKKKQRERNRIEGSFGHGKNHCGLDCVRYHGVEGAEMWIRASILAMNLKTALGREPEAAPSRQATSKRPRRGRKTGRLR